MIKKLLSCYTMSRVHKIKKYCKNGKILLIKFLHFWSFLAICKIEVPNMLHCIDALHNIWKKHKVYFYKILSSGMLTAAT